MARTLKLKLKKKRVKKRGGAEKETPQNEMETDQLEINEGKEITIPDNKEKVREKEKGIVKTENSIFPTTRISMAGNTDAEYNEIGIVHTSEPGSVNIAREFMTDVANVFGRKGFDRTIYDQIRKKALDNLEKLLEDNQKICNLKIDVENVKANSLFFIHLHGMLLQK